MRRLTIDDRLGDLLDHPAFDGFADLLLPWDDRPVERGLRLREIGTLLPYHTHVEPRVVVGALNRLIADAEDGRRIFYGLRGEVRYPGPPAARTGLFFVRGHPGAPFAIISPGGGFSYVGSVHEGFPYAQLISDAGYNAFVLKYRVGQGGDAATRDLATALGFVCANARDLGVDTRAYSLWGSSAGARMAASIGSHGPARFGGPSLPRPAAVVMAYTGHADIGADEPPTFVVVGANDGIAPPSAMERRIEALRRMGTQVTYRRVPGLGHGFGTGDGTAAGGWVQDAIRFWTGFLPPPYETKTNGG